MRIRLASMARAASMAALAGLTAVAASGQNGPAPRVAAAQAAPCERAMSLQPWANWSPRLALVGPTVGPIGSFGVPRLCLFEFDGESVYVAMLDGIDTVDQFRGAKAEALDALVEEGFDPCRIGRWSSMGQAGVSLNTNDRREARRPCAPTIRALDPLGAEWLAEAQSAVDLAALATEQDLGWRPDRPVQILLAGSAESTLAATEGLRRRLSAQAAETNAQQTRDNRGWSYVDPLAGALISVSLGNPVNRTRDAVRGILVHELTHAAQYAIIDAPGSEFDVVPKWFLEGQATLQEKRYSARPGNSLLEAHTFVQTGRTYRLSELDTSAAWSERERTLGVGPVYTRATAFLAFLTARHGSESVARLLHEARGGTRARFYEQLTALTGVGVDELDSALDQWLAALPVAQTETPDGGYSVELLVAPGENRIESRVTVRTSPTCGGVRSGNWYSFNSPLQSDGSFAAGNVRTALEFQIEGWVTSSGEVSGTLAYLNRANGCAADALTFTARLPA